MPIVKEGELLLFGDFMIFGQAREDRIYEEIKDMNKLRAILLDYLDDYNGATGQDMKLILFEDAVEHILRLARLLRSERGNGLLVGEYFIFDNINYPTLIAKFFQVYLVWVNNLYLD